MSMNKLTSGASLKGGTTRMMSVPMAGPVYRGRDDKEQTLINAAQACLMTGPKATPPRFRRIRRMMKQIRLGLPISGQRIKLSDGTLLHPTKGFRNA